MITRGGTRRAGIQYKNSNGGPRNWISGCGQSNFGQGTTSVPSELQVGYQQTFHNCPVHLYSPTRELRIAPLNYLDNTTYQDPVQTAFAATSIYLPNLTQQVLGGDLYSCFYSIGDTAYATEWKTTATIGIYWLELINKMQKFKRGCFDADGVNPVCRYFVLSGGEKDGRVQAQANALEANWTDFINNLRSIMGETIPIMMPMYNPDIAGAPVNPITYWETCNDAKEACAAALTNVHAIPCDNCEMDTDLTHYTPAGYLQTAENIVAVAVSEGYI